MPNSSKRKSTNQQRLVAEVSCFGNAELWGGGTSGQNAKPPEARQCLYASPPVTQTLFSLIAEGSSLAEPRLISGSD